MLMQILMDVANVNWDSLRGYDELRQGREYLFIIET